MKNSKSHIIPQSTIPPVDLGHARASMLVAEWQQRGLETFSGLAVRKLRLTFAPSQSVITASATGWEVEHDHDGDFLGAGVDAVRYQHRAA